jgi:hypothetical protein
MPSRRTFLRASAAALLASGAGALASATGEHELYLPLALRELPPVEPTPEPSPQPTSAPLPTAVPGDPTPWPPSYEARIVAPASGSVDQALAWLQPRADPSYTDYDISAIVAAYREIGTSAGIDWFVALAQMAHETGSLTSWWSQRPRRNPAGIAVTGRTSVTQPGPHWAWDERSNIWREGVSFPEWVADAVPAHLGRLLAYALRDDQADGWQRALIVKALSYRSLPLNYRGASPRWIDLNGRWAVPGTTYGQAIINLARRMRGDTLLAQEKDEEQTTPGDEDDDWAPVEK